MDDITGKFSLLETRLARLERLSERRALRQRAERFRDARPHEPERVRAIVYRHDTLQQTFEEIAKIEGGSHVACWRTYHRWRDWAHTEGNE